MSNTSTPPTVQSADESGWRFAQCFGDKVRSLLGLLLLDHILTALPLQGEVEDITEADIICAPLTCSFDVASFAR